MAPTRTPAPALPQSPIEAELERRRKAGFIPFTELGETLARLNASVRHVATNPAGDIVIVLNVPEDRHG